MKTVRKNDVEFNVDPSSDYYQSTWDDVESGVWEPYTFEIFDKYLNPDYSCIDIGAWIGSTALYSAKKSKKVYALEPDEIAFNELRNNVDVNLDLKDKICLFKKCISNKDGKESLGNAKRWGNSGSSLLFGKSFCADEDCDKDGNWKVSAQIESITLETFIDENNIDDCNFIKMDVEGAESFILPNIKNYLKKHRPTLYLSLHIPFFKNINKDLKRIVDALGVYKNIYDTSGNPISLQTLGNKGKFISVVCDG